MNLAVFDIDGTLTRPYRCEDPAFLEGLERAFGFRDVDPDWDAYPHVTDTGIVEHLCAHHWGRLPTAAEIARFQSDYADAFVARAADGEGEEILGAARFLTELRASADWCVAIATGNCHRFAILKLTRGGLPFAGLPMATADDAVSRADLIRIAVDRARGRYRTDGFRHVVSIGDAPWDLRTARELRVPFVAVGSRCGDAASGARAIADYRDAGSVLRALTEAVCW